MTSLRKVIVYSCATLIGLQLLIMAKSQKVLFNRMDLPPQDTSTLFSNIKYLSHSAEKFSWDIIDTTFEAFHEANIKYNFMISPFAIWSLLLLIMEGASGNSLLQLQNALYLQNDTTALRQAFAVVQNLLQTKTSTIEVASLQAIFTDINQPVNNDYLRLVEEEYGSKLFNVDFHKPMDAFTLIDDQIKTATNGLIENTIKPTDLQEANLILLSSLYFKGQWKLPFKPTQTHIEPFYDENGKQIGNVKMMSQEYNFNFTTILELESRVLELPYGNKDILSMLIILPKEGVPLHKVVKGFKKIGLSTIFNKLSADAIDYEGELAEVMLPKFETVSDLSLPRVLNRLNIVDIFDENVADLSKMANNLFVSQIVHWTKIIVNEEGTEAAAATAGLLVNKAIPIKIHCNRPFIYLIVEKKTNLILFAGQLVSPNDINST